MIVIVHLGKGEVAFLQGYKQFIGASLFSLKTIKGTGNDSKEPGPELRIIPQ
jgi:hypothetical protein